MRPDAELRRGLVKHLSHRLDVIQGRYNFDPKDGAKQVQHLDHAAAFAYGQYKELRDLVRKFRFPVSVPVRDASGSVVSAAISAAPVHVYFARKDGTSFWKIGSSTKPPNRVKAVATGNDGALGLVHVVEGVDGRDVERKLKRLLRKWKTRDRNHVHKGEWFDLDPVYVACLVQHLESGSKPEESPLPCLAL